MLEDLRGERIMKAKNRFTTLAIILISATLLLNSCARDPEKAKAKYFDLGQGYMKKGQFAAAAIEFRNALRLDPRFVDAYYQLAQADLAQREWGAAYASLEKAVDLDASRLDARLDRGRLYLATREFDARPKLRRSIFSIKNRTMWAPLNSSERH